MTIRLKQTDIRRVNILKNRATTNQNQTLLSQKLKRRGHKHKIKGNHPTKKERRKGET